LANANRQPGDPPPPAPAWSLAAAAVAIAGLWALLCTRVESPDVAGARVSWIYDFFHLFRPNAEYLADRLRAGDLPLWDPRHALGGPFLASMQPGVLYPPNVLHLVLPTQTAFGVLVIGHVALAAYFAAATARALGAGAAGAILAGALYAGSQQIFLLAWNPHLLYAAAWLPGVLWAADRCTRRPSGRSAALLAVTFAAQLLAGWAQTAAITAAAVAVYAGVVLAVRVWEERRPPWAAAAALAAGSLAGLALASPQLLPTLELMEHSTRALGSLSSEQALGGNLPDYDPARFFRPLLHGRGNESVPSAPSLLLVALAFVFGDRRGRLAALLGVGLLALAISFPRDLPVHGWIQALPVLGSFRFPFRYRVVTCLAVAVVAGAGLTALRRRLDGRSRAAGSVVVVAAVMALAPLARPRPEAMRFPLSGAGRPPLAEEYADLAGEPPPQGERILWTERIDRIGSDPDFQMVADFEPFSLADTARYLTFFEIGKPLTLQPRFRGRRQSGVLYPFVGYLQLPRGPDRAALLDLIGVTRIVGEHVRPWVEARYERVATGREGRVYANPAAFPRAFRAPEAEPAPSDLRATFERLVSPDLDLRRTVLLDGPVDVTATGGTDPTADVEIVAFAPERVALRTRGERPGFVVLTDVHYPGWEARVDGEAQPVRRANGVLRAVAVPAGESEVEFVYRARSLWLGAAVAVLAALALVASIWHERSRRGAEG
jgi:hypothetical protein